MSIKNLTFWEDGVPKTIRSLDQLQNLVDTVPDLVKEDTVPDLEPIAQSKLKPVIPPSTPVPEATDVKDSHLGYVLSVGRSIIIADNGGKTHLSLPSLCPENIRAEDFVQFCHVQIPVGGAGSKKTRPGVEVIKILSTPGVLRCAEYTANAVGKLFLDAGFCALTQLEFVKLLLQYQQEESDIPVEDWLLEVMGEVVGTIPTARGTVYVVEFCK